MGEETRHGGRPLPDEADGGPVLPAEEEGTKPEPEPEPEPEPAAPEPEPVEPEPGPGPGSGEEAQGRPAGLSELDLAVLDIARRQWRTPAQRERAVRERLGIPPTRYYQLLNALLDVPEALAHDPVTVNRLRRMREARRDRR